MGEYADYRINGDDCELCGMPFEESQGHPAVCKECWRDLTPQEKKHHVLAHSDTV